MRISTRTLSPQLDLNVSTGFSNRNQRLPQTDNNSTSIFGTALKNPGFQPSQAVCSTTPASCLGYSDVGSLGEDLHGYGNFMPAQTFQDQLTEGVQRFIGDLDANWRPFAWMQNEGERRHRSLRPRRLAALPAQRMRQLGHDAERAS